jgi:hypothetical protein
VSTGGCLIYTINKHQTLHATVLPTSDPFLSQYKRRVSTVSDTSHSFDRPFFTFETLGLCLFLVHFSTSTSILLDARSD